METVLSHQEARHPEIVRVDCFSLPLVSFARIREQIEVTKIKRQCHFVDQIRPDRVRSNNCIRKNTGRENALLLTLSSVTLVLHLLEVVWKWISSH